MLELEFLEVLQSFISEEFLAQFGEGLLLKKKMGLLGVFLGSLIGCVTFYIAFAHIHRFSVTNTPLNLSFFPRHYYPTKIRQTLYAAGLSSP